MGGLLVAQSVVKDKTPAMLGGVRKLACGRVASERHGETKLDP